MKAVILARVSSKEQEDGYSLDAQISRLSDYANKKGLEVIKTFTLTESSTQGDRKKFQEVLKFCSSQKETIALIADAVDRVQRSFKESTYLDELRKKEKIELHFYREGMVVGKNASSSDLLRWDFLVIGAKSYVLALAENVKRSINFKIEHGEWCGKAPIGYLNRRNAHGKSEICLDPVRAPIIKKLFQEYSLGKTSFKELANLADKWDLKSNSPKARKLTSKTLYDTLTNPFYCGKMRIKGQLYPHIYEPLISEDLWNKCQEVRLGYKKQPVKYASKEFLYRGLITCYNTGKIVTTDQKRGHINYLICYDKTGKRIYCHEETITKQVQQILDSIIIPEPILTGLNQILRDSKKNEALLHEQAVNSLRKDLDITKKRIENLVDMYLDKKIDDEIYSSKINQLKNEKTSLENKIAAHSVSDDKFNETIINLFDIVNHAGKKFANSSNIEVKRRILKLIIRTMKLDRGNLGYELAWPFSELPKSDDCYLWRTRRDSNPRPLASEANTLSN